MPAPIPRKKLPLGTVFVKLYKKRRYTLKVVKTEGGTGYELEGTVFSSPSAAAKSLTKGEINGWKFWKIG